MQFHQNITNLSIFRAIMLIFVGTFFFFFTVSLTILLFDVEEYE